MVRPFLVTQTHRIGSHTVKFGLSCCFYQKKSEHLVRFRALKSALLKHISTPAKLTLVAAAVLLLTGWHDVAVGLVEPS